MSQGYFGTVVNLTGTAAHPWLNITNAENAPDGLYTSWLNASGGVPSDTLAFYNWLATIPSGIIGQITISLFGHCSNPNNIERWYFGAYNSFPGSLLVNYSQSLFNLTTDTWTSEFDLTGSFRYGIGAGSWLTTVVLNNGVSGFYFGADGDSGVTNTTYVDAARMTVTLFSPDEMPMYSRKRRRFIMKRNHREEIISSQSKIKGINKKLILPRKRVA